MDYSPTQFVSLILNSHYGYMYHIFCENAMMLQRRFSEDMHSSFSLIYFLFE